MAKRIPMDFQWWSRRELVALAAAFAQSMAAADRHLANRGVPDGPRSRKAAWSYLRGRADWAMIDAEGWRLLATQRSGASGND